MEHKVFMIRLRREGENRGENNTAALQQSCRSSYFVDVSSIIIFNISTLQIILKIKMFELCVPRMVDSVDTTQNNDFRIMLS